MTASASHPEPEPRLAVVIPAYNEAPTIRDVAARALCQVQTVVVVDDGSTDGTAAALEGLDVTVLSHPVNRGKAESLRLGMRYAVASGAAGVITLDGDGQHRPEDIPRLVQAYRDRAGAIVIGARLHDRSQIPPLRYFANRFANFWVACAARRSYPDTQSGFRVYPAELLRSRLVTQNQSVRFTFETEILIDAARAGLPAVAVAIEALYPQRARASHFRPVADIVLIARMISRKILAALMSTVMSSIKAGLPRRGRGSRAATL